MPRVIATGGAPPDINQQLLAQAAQGIGAGLGGRIGQNMQERRLARDLNPLREALLQSQPAGGYIGPMASLEALAAQQARTPQEQVIMAAAQDPRLFARLSGSAAGAVDVAGMLGAAPSEAYDVQRLVSGDSELGKRLGLRPGQQARVKFSYDARGNLIGEPSLAANPLSDEESGDHPFGASVKGRSLAYITDFAPGFGEGETTAEQDRLFLTSISDYTQPEQFTDPDTGLINTRRNELPRFARMALEKRGYQIGPTGILPPVATPPTPADLAAQQAAAEYARQNGIPEDAVTTARPPDIPTLFEIAQQGDIAGPVPLLQRGLARLPGVGIRMPAETSALTYAQSMRERVIKALQQSPRYAEGEAERIGEGVQFNSRVIDSKQAYMDRLIGLDDSLQQIERESFEVITGKRALVPNETRQHAMSVLNAVTDVRGWLIPPRVNNDREAAEFNRLNPPGTPVLYKDESGAWQLGYTEGTGAQ